MYYVIELQTNETGAALVSTYTDRNEALSKFHSILAFAATSEVLYHSCVVLDEMGRTITKESFMHPENQVVEPVPEEIE